MAQFSAPGVLLHLTALKANELNKWCGTYKLIVKILLQSALGSLILTHSILTKLQRVTMRHIFGAGTAQDSALTQQVPLGAYLPVQSFH